MLDHNEMVQVLTSAIPHRPECTFPDHDCACGAAESRRAVAHLLSTLESSEDALLADLFRRALKAGILDTKTHFFPTWRIMLFAGNSRPEISLTDPEIEALRRSV
jgi:hypothetical protein